MNENIKKISAHVKVVHHYSDNSWGVIDANGNEIFPFGKYGWIEGFDKHGLSRVRTEMLLDVAKQMNTYESEVEWIIGSLWGDHEKLERMKHPKWGIIDTKGNEILPLEYDSIWKFFKKDRATTIIEKNGIKQLFSLEKKCITNVVNKCCRNYNRYSRDYARDTWGNHSIFRYDNFIGCFSADKIKMSVRK